MIKFGIKFVSIMFAFLVGERLVAAVLQQGEDMGLGFWGVIADTFRLSYYDLGRVAMIAIASGVLLLANRLVSPRLPTSVTLFFSAFTGAYDYVMIAPLDYESGIESSIFRALGSRLPASIADVLGYAFGVLALFFPLVLFLLLKMVVRGIGAGTGSGEPSSPRIAP